MMYDYLKNKLNHKNTALIWNQRSEGHGINLGMDKVPSDTSLLLLIDSSSSDVKACEKLSKTMDIVIIDHHNIENDNPFALIVNPQLQQDYPNPSSSAGLLTFKFVELMDYTYKKVNMNDYIGLAGMSLLSDQMNMMVLENRYIVKEGMKNLRRNIGIYALLYAQKKQDRDINSQMLNFDLIPVLNTVARNDELEKGFKLLFEKDFFKAKRMAEILVKENKARKEKVKGLVDEYMEIIQDEKFAYIVTKNSSKGFNGLVASKIADMLKKPCFVLKDDGDTYSGSARSVNNFKLQTFVKGSNLIEYAAGHEPAFGFSIKALNWNKFKQYVNDNIDESLFKPVIEYDIELNEDELTWEFVEEIMNFDHLWGNNNPPIKVRLNDVFVEDREVFPPKKPEHVKIIADNIDLMKFNDKDYASEVEAWNSISCIGGIGINDFKGVNRSQLFIEDYCKK